MNSCFVTNAAAIAKRKLEQKPKSDRKDWKKVGNVKKHGTAQKRVPQTEVCKRTFQEFLLSIYFLL